VQIKGRNFNTFRQLEKTVMLEVIWDERAAKQPRLPAHEERPKAEVMPGCLELLLLLLLPSSAPAIPILAAAQK
jgi:hypothetical protein